MGRINRCHYGLKFTRLQRNRPFAPLTPGLGMSCGDCFFGIAAHRATLRIAWTCGRGARESDMADELTASEIRALLKLEPNATCGFVQTTYLSTQSIAAGGLPPPFADARPMGSALYFMVTPVAPVRLHRIRNDQLYHYYLGD